jgi:hypothetical protein
VARESNDIAELSHYLLPHLAARLSWGTRGYSPISLVCTHGLLMERTNWPELSPLEDSPMRSTSESTFDRLPHSTLISH